MLPHCFILVKKCGPALRDITHADHHQRRMWDLATLTDGFAAEHTSAYGRPRLPKDESV